MESYCGNGREWEDVNDNDDPFSGKDEKSIYGFTPKEDDDEQELRFEGGDEGEQGL